MDKIATLQSFFMNFLTAYEENAIYNQPVNPPFPYITYQGIDDSFNEGLNFLSFSTWYREASWVNAVNMTKRISQAIPSQGLMLKCDEGHILIYKSSPFAQRMGDESDDLIKRTLFNLEVRFYTVF